MVICAKIVLVVIAAISPSTLVVFNEVVNVVSVLIVDWVNSLTRVTLLFVHFSLHGHKLSYIGMKFDFLAACLYVLWSYLLVRASNMRFNIWNWLSSRLDHLQIDQISSQTKKINSLNSPITILDQPNKNKIDITKVYFALH